MSESPNLLQRLNKVMQAVDYIQKEKRNGMRYSIVSHDAVTAKVRPHLVEHGVVYYPTALTRTMSGNRTEIEMMVRFANVDNPIDFIDVATAGFGIDDQDKGIGKAISYAVKYALLKTLGLETGDDPDHDQDVEHKPAPRPTASAKPPAAPKTTPDNSVTDWGLIADDLIQDAMRLRNVNDINAMLKDRADQFKAMPAHLQEKVKAAVGKHRESLAALMP